MSMPYLAMLIFAIAFYYNKKRLIMQVAKYYSQLIKFRLSTTVVFSATAGYLLGATQVNIKELFLLIVGGFLVTGSANGFNQVLEQDYDKLMVRTANRPLKKYYNF